MSVNIDRIVPVRGLPRAYRRESDSLLTALIACAFVLVPHQSSVALGVELMVLGVLVLVLLLMMVLPALRGPSRQPAHWHATRIAGSVGVTVSIG